MKKRKLPFHQKDSAAEVTLQDIATISSQHTTIGKYHVQTSRQFVQTDGKNATLLHVPRPLATTGRESWLRSWLHARPAAQLTAWLHSALSYASFVEIICNHHIETPSAAFQTTIDLGSNLGQLPCLRCQSSYDQNARKQNRARSCLHVLAMPRTAITPRGNGN